MKEITRRDFCKICIAGVTGVSILPHLVKKAGADFTRKKGFIKSRPAMWWEKVGRGLYRCNLCPNSCTLRDGMRSVCQVREPRDGKLHTLVYGNPTAVHVDPIEKKPLYHFLPGKKTFSIATAGCNFTCINCQNWQLSQQPPEDTVNYDLPPDKIIDLAQKYNCSIISYTYNEPSIFYEYMIDTAKIAFDKGIKNTSVTNSYLNEKPLEQLCKYLDGTNVDLKGFSEDFYFKVTSGRLRPVLDGILTMKKNNVHIEITNLLMPGYNDSDDMIKKLCKWVKKYCGENTPLHFSRFYPRYKLKNLQPTPEKTMKKARNIAMDSGLNYVYIGNLPAKEGEDTFCHNCKKLLINRTGYKINSNNIDKGKCKFCGTEIPGTWD